MWDIRKGRQRCLEAWRCRTFALSALQDFLNIINSVLLTFPRYRTFSLFGDPGLRNYYGIVITMDEFYEICPRAKGSRGLGVICDGSPPTCDENHLSIVVCLSSPSQVILCLPCVECILLCCEGLKKLCVRRSAIQRFLCTVERISLIVKAQSTTSKKMFATYLWRPVLRQGVWT